MAAEIIRKGLSGKEAIEYYLIQLSLAVEQGKKSKVAEFLNELHTRGCHAGQAIDAAKTLIRGGERR